MLTAEERHIVIQRLREYPKGQACNWGTGPLQHPCFPNDAHEWPESVLLEHG